MNVTGGATNVTTYFALRLQADGTAATGLTITGLDLQYTRSGAAPSVKVDATALGTVDAAHADNQAIEVDLTDQPGLYRVDWPDAAFAAGVRETILTVKDGGGTAFTEHLRVQIDAEVSVTEWNGVKLATTNPLPNAAADAAGGLPISDAGGLDMDAILVDTADIQPKIGTPAADVSADIAAVKAETALVVADTNELQTDWVNGGRLDLILDAAATQTTADAIETDTQDIQTRLPAALVGGRMDSDVEAINNDTNAADHLAAHALTAVDVTFSAGGTTTTAVLNQVDGAGASSTNDVYNGRVLIFTAPAALKYQATDITDYDGGTLTATITAVTTGPVATATAIMV